MALLACICTNACAADLEIELRGVRPQRGEIRVAVFDSERDFSADIVFKAIIGPNGELSTGVFTRDEHFEHAPLRGVSMPAGTSTMVTRFPGLLAGEYAVAAYQDLNANGRLEQNLQGLALEPWGMSNNPRPKEIRIPAWSEAKFALPEEGLRIVIELHQP